MGKYTVSLTATNAGGSNTKTKADYISIKPLNADFTVSPPGGARAAERHLHRRLL